MIDQIAMRKKGPALLLVPRAARVAHAHCAWRSIDLAPSRRSSRRLPQCRRDLASAVSSDSAVAGLDCKSFVPVGSCTLQSVGNGRAVRFEVCGPLNRFVACACRLRPWCGWILPGNVARRQASAAACARCVFSHSLVIAFLFSSCFFSRSTCFAAPRRRRWRSQVLRVCALAACQA